MTNPDIAGLCEMLRQRARVAEHDGYPVLVCPLLLQKAADTLERQAAEIERLRGALGNATAALASISGLAQLATKAAVEDLQARAALTGEDQCTS
jgi:hypothetical protein